jgi:hypothetical protein
MSTAISWLFEATVRPDGLDDYRALAKEITVENEASEPNASGFEAKRLSVGSVPGCTA